MGRHAANDLGKPGYYKGALLAGQLPRSKDTIKSHRLVRDGHARQEDFVAAIRNDQTAILESQQHFAYMTAGQSDWLDILRPIAWSFQGFEKRFRVPLLEGYGLTEASPVVTLNPPKGPRVAGSIGKSISKNIELMIVDDNEKELGGEQIGELLVKGPNVMKGYFNQETATKETIKNGWLYTGDMAKFDKNGYVYIVARKYDMVISGGVNIYPREVEEVLYQHPSVLEASVIGVPDDYCKHSRSQNTLVSTDRKGSQGGTLCDSQCRQTHGQGHSA